MPEVPLVTIGISTYNRAEDFLTDALKSALSQKYPNLEIIVSDNGSTDRTEELVRQLADSRVHYFKQPRNIGANNNFNYCLEQANGDFFLLLHDDDIIDPDFISSCMEAAAFDTGIGVIRTGTRVIDAHNRVLKEIPNRASGRDTADLLLAWFSRKTTIYFCSTLFNTRRLKELGGFGTKADLFQDVAAVIQLAAGFGRAEVREVKASFRRHGQNKGSAHTAHEWAEDALYLLEIMRSAASERADEVLRKGQRYFSRKCYRYVQGIPSPLERWRSYYHIYRKLWRSYSPLRYLYERRSRLLRRKVERLLRRTGYRKQISLNL